MEKITGNEPSVPTQMPDYKVYSDDKMVEHTYFYNKPYPGLTIRQQFAAMAIQGILSNPNTAIQMVQQFGYIGLEKGHEIVSSTAVAVADALINELNK